MESKYYVIVDMGRGKNRTLWLADIRGARLQEKILAIDLIGKSLV